jgi:3-carboxy-cis,cis-muconate cycloisomerase
MLGMLGLVVTVMLWRSRGCLTESLANIPGVPAERATFLLLAEKMGKQKAGKLVEAALAKGASFIEALGQLEKELADEATLLGYAPKFVDRLLADLKRR